MKKDKLPTLEICVPVYNEQNNIAFLLDSILEQKKSNYRLKKVFVIDDFSNDETVPIVTKYLKKFPFIKLIKSKKRLGKQTRLNQAFKLAKADILISFDGDIILGSEMALVGVIKKFKDKAVALVGFNVLPIKPKSFFEKIVVTGIKLWILAIRDINKGASINNHIAMASAMTKKLYKKIKLPESLVADDNFIYFISIKSGWKFAFAKSSRAYFRAPSNLRDFLSQTIRFIKSKDEIGDYFGEWVYQHYKVPMVAKVWAFSKMVLREPIFTLLAVLFQLVARALLFTYQHKDERYWNRVESTKRLVLL